MGILLYILFGAIVGVIASFIMKSGGGILWDILLGIIGSFVGGFVFRLFGSAGVTGFNLYSLLVGVIGAVIVIFIARMFQRNV